MTMSSRIKRGSTVAMQRQRGAATVEYIIAALFVVLILVANENVIKQLVVAIKNAYASFTYALSVSWF